MRKFRLTKLYDDALISETQRKHKDLFIDNDGTDRNEFYKLTEIQKSIVNYVKSGMNLYIHSKIAGNGKTSWSLRLVQSYFNKIWYGTDLSCKALFINVPSFLMMIKDNITKPNEVVQYIKDNIDKCDIVIWDDIGTKSATPFEHETLLYMIDSRINKGKANIYTSNLNDDEMHQILGDRLSSRICSLSINIELHGSDKRGIV